MEPEMNHTEVPVKDLDSSESLQEMDKIIQSYQEQIYLWKKERVRKIYTMLKQRCRTIKGRVSYSAKFLRYLEMKEIGEEFADRDNSSHSYEFKNAVHSDSFRGLPHATENSRELQPIDSSFQELKTTKVFRYSNMSEEKRAFWSSAALRSKRKCCKCRARHHKEKVASLASVVNRLQKVSLTNPKELEDDLSEETINQLRKCHI